MFTEESRSITVTGSAESNGFVYKVNYSTDGDKLLRLHCNVYKKASETEAEQYAGLMFQESGNKQFSFPQDTDITPHVAVFETVLAEVKAGLTSENVTAE